MSHKLALRAFLGTTAPTGIMATTKETLGTLELVLLRAAGDGEILAAAIAA